MRALHAHFSECECFVRNSDERSGAIAVHIRARGILPFVRDRASTESPARARTCPPTRTRRWPFFSRTIGSTSCARKTRAKRSSPASRLWVRVCVRTNNVASGARRNGSRHARSPNYRDPASSRVRRPPTSCPRTAAANRGAGWRNRGRGSTLPRSPSSSAHSGCLRSPHSNPSAAGCRRP